MEYHEHVSQSIYVKFPVVGHPHTYILIWTTTPWTLPANLAVAYNSTFNYSLVRVGQETYFVSGMLLSDVAQKCGWDGYEIIRSIQGGLIRDVSEFASFLQTELKLFAGDAFVDEYDGHRLRPIFAPDMVLRNFIWGRNTGCRFIRLSMTTVALRTGMTSRGEQQMPAEMVMILEKQRAMQTSPCFTSCACVTPRASGELSPQLSLPLAQQNAHYFPRDGSVVHQD